MYKSLLTRETQFTFFFSRRTGFRFRCRTRRRPILLFLFGCLRGHFRRCKSFVRPKVCRPLKVRQPLSTGLRIAHCKPQDGFLAHCCRQIFHWSVGPNVTINRWKWHRRTRRTVQLITHNQWTGGSLIDSRCVPRRTTT